MELAPEITTEIDVMFTALENAKDSLSDKINGILTEFTDTALENFHYSIENNERWNLNQWVKQAVKDTVNGLLSGDTKYLKYTAIISEYSWDQLQAIRIACWNAAGGEMANSLVSALQKENEELKKTLQQERDYNRARY